MSRFIVKRCLAESGSRRLRRLANFVTESIKFGMSFFDHIRVFRIVINVLQFKRVGLPVQQFPFINITVEMEKFACWHLVDTVMSSTFVV